MKIFVIFDSDGFVWDRAYTSLQSVIDVVSIGIEDGNLPPMKMQTEFTYKHTEGSVLVALNLDSKFCIFFKEVTVWEDKKKTYKNC